MEEFDKFTNYILFPKYEGKEYSREKIIQSHSINNTKKKNLQN